MLINTWAMTKTKLKNELKSTHNQDYRLSETSGTENQKL